MPWPVAEVSSRQGTVVHQAALEITVLFTDVPSTLAALRTAAQLSQGLATRIRLLVLQPVPYPLPLDAPHVDLRFYGRRFRTLVERSAVDTVIDVQLCRDTTETLRHRLAPGSVVVIGKRPRWWWPQPEDWIARQLRNAGHHVVRTRFHKESPRA